MLAISLTDVRHEFHGRFSLDVPSLNVDEGTTFGLVGPNGAGKSTTMNILSGIVQPLAGRVSIMEIDLQRHPVLVKANLGVVPEGLGLFDHLRGSEQMMFIGRAHGLPKDEVVARTRQLFEAFDMSDASEDFVHTYSLGMKKKLAFACAIIHTPRVLLLDEPLEGVDPVSCLAMTTLIRSMQAKGTTTMITSHNLNAVEKLCDEVAIMNNGMIVFRTRIEDIRNRYRNELGQQTCRSLEEIFVDVVSSEGKQQITDSLLWLC